MLKVIILVYSLTNLGDISHVNAVYKSIVSQNPNIQKVEIDANSFDEVLVYKYLESVSGFKDNEVMILSVGEKGLFALRNLSKSSVFNHKHFLAASVHQYFDAISEIKLKYIAIPEASLNSQIKKDSIDRVHNKTLTLGVPSNNPSVEALMQKYRAWDIKNKPSIAESYIIVMLPGDAIDSSGNMRVFTKNSAKKLFQHVYKLWDESGRRHSVLIHNGPRTGKHDPSTGKIVASHEYRVGKQNKAPIDEISLYFVSFFEGKSIKHSFYNFIFEVKDSSKISNSVFDQLLYIAQTPGKNNIFVLPGESVSMLGQIPLYLSPENIIVFKPSSMNQDHDNILQSIFNHGYLSFFSNSGDIVYPKNPQKRELDDSDMIARDLLSSIKKD